MNKLFLTLITILTLANSSLSQANFQGNIIIDPYYGFPNFGKSFYQSIAESSNTLNYKANGIGPAGIRAEYMISNKIGLGFDFIYNSNKVSYTYTDSLTTWDSNNTPSYEITSYKYERQMKRVRFQARINFHFDVSNPNLDAYFGIGAGTNNRFRKYLENGIEIKDTYNPITNLIFIPFSLRICTGMRYYFNPRIGANLELGFGGPLISTGISVKIM
jgi:hypothetical protein